ncbi:MAG: hypothetical protein NC930_03710 [Candidatus Omnitrophica bacterium]|nr:hypothetical protein [Candidatus Omnitrophota bacterium]
MDLFKYLDRDRYEPILACYREDVNFDAIRRSGMPVYHLKAEALQTSRSGPAIGNYGLFLKYLMSCSSFYRIGFLLP